MPAALTPIEELDERAGFLQWGLCSSAEWLAWRCDLSMTTAREKVRVAHALKCLPLISKAFASGELSNSKVKALTRVANRDNEASLLEFALRHTAATVAERCRELCCGREDSLGLAESACANRSLRILRDRVRNRMTITVELPLDIGELLEKALDKARDDEGLEIPILADSSWSTRQADAFVNIVHGYLAGEHSSKSGDRYLVTIHVDQAALTAGNGGADRGGEAALLRRRGGGDYRDLRGRALEHRQEVTDRSEGPGTGRAGPRPQPLPISGLQASPVPRLPSHQSLGERRRDLPRQPDAAVYPAPRAGA